MAFPISVAVTRRVRSNAPVGTVLAQLERDLRSAGADVLVRDEAALEFEVDGTGWSLVRTGLRHDWRLATMTDAKVSVTRSNEYLELEAECRVTRLPLFLGGLLAVLVAGLSPSAKGVALSLGMGVLVTVVPWWRCRDGLETLLHTVALSMPADATT
jgi:hypothetical protein